MPCCKAKEFDWCKGLNIVYTDGGGKKYCIFHAPKGNKGIESVEAFNSQIFQRIDGQKRKGTNECDLSGTVFEGPIVFNHYSSDNPLPSVRFDRAVFTDSVSFSEVIFGGEAHFARAAFNGEANFARAIFNSEGCFSDTNFNKAACFSMSAFKGEADFIGATFSDQATFTSVAFSDKVSFFLSTFSGRAHFSGSTFSKTSEANFSRCHAGENVRFEDVNLMQASFLKTDMRRFQLIRCQFPKIRGRNVLYDELAIGKPKDPKIMSLVEDLYRQLKQQSKEGHNEPDASKWHYCEKEMCRKKSRWMSPRHLLLSLYWLFSGYCERPLRACVMLLFLFIGVTILMSILGLNSADGNPVYGVSSIRGYIDIFDAKKTELLIYNTIQHSLYIQDSYFIAQTFWGDFILTIFTRFLIPIQAFLILFALRNKFRR